jgi:hypothetical protein
LHNGELQANIERTPLWECVRKRSWQCPLNIIWEKGAVNESNRPVAKGNRAIEVDPSRCARSTKFQASGAQIASGIPTTEESSCIAFCADIKPKKGASGAAIAEHDAIDIYNKRPPGQNSPELELLLAARRLSDTLRQDTIHIRTVRPEPAVGENDSLLTIQAIRTARLPADQARLNVISGVSRMFQ